MDRYKSLTVCLIAIAVSLYATFSAHADMWPQNLDAYLRNGDNCNGLPVPETPQLTDQNGPGARAYTDFTKDEACRVIRFQSAFNSNPSRFCPGVDVTNFNKCYSQILNTMATKAGLETTGFTIMQSIAVDYLLKKQSSFHSKSEVALSLLEATWTNLESFEKRVHSDQILRKSAAQALVTKSETDKLRQMDDEVSSKYANSMLTTAEKLLKQIDTRPEAEKTSLSSTERLRVLENRRKFLNFASHWHYRLSQ